MAEQKVLTLEGLVSYDGKIKGKIIADDASILKSAKDYADSLASNYDAAGTAQTLVTALENGQVATNKTDIATLKADVGVKGDLDTTAKTDLVSAINEVYQAVGTGGTASVVSVEKDETGLIYTIKQGGSSVGTINIPKDMVVSSGTVEVLEDEDTSGNPAGTYLVLTLANATEDKVYINVGTLVDIYVAKASATQVQIAIDPETREISATIVAGSITATELASNAVTTVKIADANVTKAKLETGVQATLDKADTALQQADIVTGTGNGTISVKGTDVTVKGLGSAAYAETSAFDSAGTASSLVSALESGQVTTNKNDISSVKSRLDSLEANTYTAITEEEITALFS